MKRMHFVCPGNCVFRGKTIISNVVNVTHFWFLKFIEFWSPSWISAAMLRFCEPVIIDLVKNMYLYLKTVNNHVALLCRSIPYELRYFITP